MDSYYDFTYYPNSTSSTYTTGSWVTNNGGSLSFQLPVEEHRKFINPVISLGYEANSDPYINSKHLWSHGDLELDILVGEDKLRYSVYKGDKVSFCEFTFEEFRLLLEDEICRKIVTCELEVSNG